jgi:hypothetical protein
MHKLAAMSLMVFAVIAFAAMFVVPGGQVWG